MLPHTHIMLGGIFALILFFTLPGIGLYAAIVIFLSSFLIDVDHYTFYVMKKRDLSISNAYYWHKDIKPPHKPMFHFFHAVEILAIILIAGFYTPTLMFVFIGFTFHSIFDLIEFIRNPFYGREFSLTRFLIKRKEGIYF